MEFLTTIYFVYSFFTLYYISLFTLLYVQNRSRFYEYPEITREYGLSIVVPCFNAEKVIAKTLENHMKTTYKNLKKIIVVDDCSTDNTYEIAKDFEKRYPKLIKVVQTPKNTGRAAGAKNYGAQFVNTELIGFSDDDSLPKKNAINCMIGFFDDEKTGGVTSRVLVFNRNNFLGGFQSIEYKVIAFTRKLFGFVESIYVTNGPLSIYRKKVFEEVGGFSIKNWTEDIEITWHMLSKGYKIHISIPAKVYTIVPDKFRGWFRQRVRWNVGGLQTIKEYKHLFFKRGMLGTFILPFFTLSWVFAVVGFLFLVYRVLRSLIMRYLSTSYSIYVHTAILRFDDVSIIPSILIFFGIVIFCFSLMYNLFALSHSREQEFKKHRLLSILGYMIFYLTAYPLVLIKSFYSFIIGKRTW